MRQYKIFVLLYCILSQARSYIRLLPKHPKKNLYEYFVGANPIAVNLLDQLLCLDPDRRPSAKEALNHPYFELYHEPDDEVSQRNISSITFAPKFNNKLSFLHIVCIETHFV